ncbi:MAG: hypothetical protein ACD_60C00163G0004 [uncultured bacterium]|nr:MAG: hypothetical protein ACD_60C00163G0004 [uncultured bacterium]
MREKILTSLRVTNRCYLTDVLMRNEPARHQAIKAQFEQHMGAIADYCMTHFVNADELTPEFICGLHKIHFPRGYCLDSILPDGRKLNMVPGEYKKFENGLYSTAFSGAVMPTALPEDVPEAMEKAVSRVNMLLANTHEAKAKRDSVIHFLLDFSAIHPFGDANGRIACILADLLMIKVGLEALGFGLIKELDKTALYHAIHAI